MAVESVSITPGSGKDIAVDTVSAQEHQLMKVEFGGDGSATMVEQVQPLPVRFGSPSAANLSSAQISAASSGQNTLLAGTASQTIRVFKFFLMNAGAASVNVKFRTGTTDLHPAIPLAPGASWVLDFDGEPWFVTATAEDLILNLSAAVQVSGRFYYTKSA